MVALELRPRPAFTLVVNRNSLPVQRLGLERRVALREAPEGRARFDHLHRTSLGVAGRLDLATQMRGREVGADRGQARVK